MKWKSIIQEDDGTCYLCRILHDDWSIKKDLEKHHIFGGNRWREISEKYGLYVHLCHSHHRTGSEAVHDSKRSGEIKQLLFIEAERAWLKERDMSSWMELIGKNWI